MLLWFDSGSTTRLRVCNDFVGNVTTADGVYVAYDQYQQPTTVSSCLTSYASFILCMFFAVLGRLINDVAVALYASQVQLV